jgi:chorismate mutase
VFIEFARFVGAVLRKESTMQMRSRITEIFEQLKAEGKLRTLTDEEVQRIQDDINAQMAEFRAEMYRKRAQSEADLHKIILTGNQP